jgi:hypothetical protein
LTGDQFMKSQLTIETSGESQGHCDCCGNTSRTVWGYVYQGNQAIAAYFVQWTLGSPDHQPNLDFLIGTWGDDQINDRVLSSWLFSPSENAFMIVDAQNRPAAKSTLCSRALSRDETLALPELKTIAANCLDAVWLQDERISEIRGFAGET